LTSAPIDVMRALFDWLEVDPAAADMSGFWQPENVTPEVIVAPRWGGLPRRLRQLSPIRHIMPYVPRPIQASLRQFTNRDVWRRSVDVLDAIRFLQPLQRRQTEELTQLLGRDFPEWTTLHGDARKRLRSMPAWG
jgi:hypothetical protein